MSNLLDKASIVLTPTAYSEGVVHTVKPEIEETVVLDSFVFDDWGLTGGGITKISDTSFSTDTCCKGTIYNLEIGKIYNTIITIDPYSFLF